MKNLDKNIKNYIDLLTYKRSRYKVVKSLKEVDFIVLHCLRKPLKSPLIGPLIFFKDLESQLYAVDEDSFIEFFKEKYPEFNMYLDSEDTETYFLGIRLLNNKLKKVKLEYLKTKRNENSFKSRQRPDDK